MTETITLAAIVALLLVALVATVTLGNVYDSRKQMESEESPQTEEIRESAVMLYGSLALSAFLLGLLALWGVK